MVVSVAVSELFVRSWWKHVLVHIYIYIHIILKNRLPIKIQNGKNSGLVSQVRNVHLTDVSQVIQNNKEIVISIFSRHSFFFFFFVVFFFFLIWLKSILKLGNLQT